MNSIEIKKYFEQKTDKDYTGFLDKAKTKRLFKDTLFRLLDQKIANLGGQRSTNEIGNLLKLGRIYSINNNKIVLGKTPIVNVTVINATTFEVTTGFDHNMITGDSAVISGVSGTLTIPTINATLPVTVIGPSTFRVTVASATGVAVINTGNAYTSKQIQDYYATWAVKPTFLTETKYSITKATNTSPIRITVTRTNNLRTGDTVNITGSLGNTNANGTHYLKKISPTTADLYADNLFAVPVAGSGAYTTGGKLVQVISDWAKPLVSDKKIAPLSRATIDFLKFDEGDHALRFMPSDNVCSEIEIDYISTPKEIDFSDTDTDYTLYYNERFLYLLIDKAAENFEAQIRDVEGVQIQQQQNQLNK